MARIDIHSYLTHSVDRAPLRAPTWHALAVSTVAWIAVATLVVSVLVVVEAALSQKCGPAGVSLGCATDFAGRTPPVRGAGDRSTGVPLLAHRF
jgi:hypothetical protein